MGNEGSGLEAWMKSHKSEVAITILLFVHQPTRKQCLLEKTQADKTFRI